MFQTTDQYNYYLQLVIIITSIIIILYITDSIVIVHSPAVMNHVKRKNPSISKDWWKFQAMNSTDLGFF
jgi:hypothetical protein